MNDRQTYYALPEDLERDIDAHESEVNRYLAGDLSAAVLKAKRVPRGIYEQRQDGTFMVRVRVAGGTLSARQTRELADIAGEFGNGQLHVTTRQDLQLHDVDIADTPAIMRRLKDVGLCSKGGGGNTLRNVVACPYAGICRCEQFDVTPYAHAVTEFFIALKGSFNLPRKYKIAFSGCAADCALARINDVGFIAEVRGGALGFKVYTGGGMGAHSRPADVLDPWVPARDVIRVAETVRRLFDRMGDRHNRQKARLRFVVERIGPDAFRDAFRTEYASVQRDDVPDCDVGTHDVNVTPIAPAAAPTGTRLASGMRVLAQRQDGYSAVPLHLHLGLLDQCDLARLADIADAFSAERGLRTSRNQDMLIRFVPNDRLQALNSQLRMLQADVVTPSALEGCVACAGASTCRLGLCLSRPLAHACADALDKRGLDLADLGNPEVNISGCSNACGQHPAAALGLFGTAQRVDRRLVPSYKVVLGARNTDEGFRLGSIVGTTPARDVPRLLADLLAEFAQRRTGNETFADYVDRIGLEHFQALVDLHAHVPAYDEAPEYYRDWGSDTDFSLAGRGAGECGAGVFEIVQQDLVTARKALAQSGEDAADGLYSALLAGVRALLITRGVETQAPDQIFKEFETHFIDTGLVGEGGRGLLARARGYLQGWTSAFDGQRDGIHALLERIELLYRSMDGNLQFHPPEATHRSGDAADSNEPSASAAQASAEDRGITDELDLRGVACPLNFVKAKLKLETLNVGDTLAVTLDAGEPIRNVPASFQDEGQDVLETKDLGDGHWRMVVRKAT